MARNCLDERARGVIDRPGPGRAGLVPVGEYTELSAGPGGVVVDDQPAVDVGGDVMGTTRWSSAFDGYQEGVT
jgi:hypothetical protein